MLEVEITVRGVPGEAIRSAFREFQFEGVDGSDLTQLRAALTDQAALYGVLERMRDFGIEIVEVRILNAAARSARKRIRDSQDGSHQD